MLDQIIHKWLRVPYTLHTVDDRSVKKPRATVVFLHGIGNSSAAWDQVIAKLPTGVRVMTIDLLGFGQSPKPHWAIYSVKVQARMVIATLARRRVKGPIILVGHSLGALVSVEIAKRNPVYVRSMVLCSPPFYKQDPVARRLIPHVDNVLKDIYKAIHRNPEQFLKVSQLAVKYNLVNKSYNVTKDDIHTYMGALESSIINQTSLSDAIALKGVPMSIMNGAVDPVVIAKNLRYLMRHNPSVKLTTIAAGHEVKLLYVPAVVRAVKEAIDMHHTAPRDDLDARL